MKSKNFNFQKLELNSKKKETRWNLKLYPELRSKNFFFNLQKLKLNSKKKEI